MACALWHRTAIRRRKASEARQGRRRLSEARNSSAMSRLATDCLYRDQGRRSASETVAGTQTLYRSPPNLLTTLRRELDAAGLSAETGLPYTPAACGETVAGTYRQRLSLTSGRSAMIDNGPWLRPRPADDGTRPAPRPSCRRRRQGERVGSSGLAGASEDPKFETWVG
jgi:Protein of unknown function (DUF3363)